MVTVFYSTTGGLRSVVATDILQFAVAMLATAVYAGFVIYQIGGLGAVAERLAELYGNGGPGGIAFLAFRGHRNCLGSFSSGLQDYSSG